MRDSNAAIVWDRACALPAEKFHLPGDVALARMITMHSLIMNGGVHHALDVLSREDVEAALSGYQYFKLRSAFLAISSVLSDASISEWNDENEAEANRLYYSTIPDDSALIEAFDRRYQEFPGDFDEL